MAIQRVVVAAAAIALEAVLILSVIFSSVGIGPVGQPTPGRIPAPIAGH